MYLEHFGLNEPPYRITPVTVFFFSGANRGEILDALIYSISDVEGIIKVSGEVGSGKTMLCRMLLEKLPDHIEAIYLANPSLSREEMLYAIADGLGLNIKDERVGIIMQSIQNKLEEKAREGKRIVVLVDEAHAMPLDTLEELRLLYNLQVGNAKLLQIVLFGQPELNAKLEQPNMRQLKDRIAHHFNMQPLSRSTLESYLMFRMRQAGYHGPDIFSADAIKCIADASDGLMRRINILADKSLLAAFVEDTHSIEVRHVKAAMRDSELGSAPKKTSHKKLWSISIAGLALAGLAVWLYLNIGIFQPGQSATPATPTKPATKIKPDTESKSISPPPIPENQAAQSKSEPRSSTSQTPPTSQAESKAAPTTEPAPTSAKTVVPEAEAAPSTKVIADVEKPKVSPDTSKALSQVLSKAKPVSKKLPPKTVLFNQRMKAGRQVVAEQSAAASLQLYYNEVINPERIERFLKRADGLGVLSEIYLLPAKFGNQDGIRVLYGAYPSIDVAREATKSLPTRYKNAFATSIYIY
ncbi:MAG: AAA family ATPase [Gallionella sp.]